MLKTLVAKQYSNNISSIGYILINICVNIDNRVFCNIIQIFLYLYFANVSVIIAKKNFPFHSQYFFNADISFEIFIKQIQYLTNIYIVLNYLR